jgi:uncharacterized membrane protein
MLTVSMVLPVALCLSLIWVRAQATGSVRFRFLVWNLLLAVLPFPFALLTDFLLRRKRWWLALPGAAVCVLFLPNSPYLITDLVHLSPREVPYWYDTLLYGTFAVTGVLLGFGSVALIHAAVRDRWSSGAGWLVALTSLVLSAFGIYLGRIERWNSWNIIGDPRSLARSVFAPIRNPFENARTVGFVLLFSAFLVLTYVAIAMIGSLLAAGIESGTRTTAPHLSTT